VVALCGPRREPHRDVERAAWYSGAVHAATETAAHTIITDAGAVRTEAAQHGVVTGYGSAFGLEPVKPRHARGKIAT
jgi:hypothetical protein